jgi:hypothetical protein
MKAAAAVLALAAAGCAHAARAFAEPGPGFAAAEMEAARASAYGSPTSPSPLPAPPSEPARADRKIIFHGSLSLQVPDVEAPERELRRIVEEAAGWVHKIEGSAFTLRVPAEKFHAVLDRLSRLGRLLDRRVSGTDVTEEFLDLQIRIENAESVRKRLVALLDKALGVKEAIEVERELARLSEEIERMKGRLKYLADQAAHSTILVSFQIRPVARVPVIVPNYPFPWIRELGHEPLLHFRSGR